MNLKKCQPVLFVKDAGVSAKFYTEVLGFTVVTNFGDANITFEEGFSIWQIWEGNIISQKLGAENINNTEGASRFELCFETDDLDRVYETLKENNVTFLHEINTELWGQRTIRFYDPDAHLIEVGEEMSVFLQRVYKEEGRNVEATARRTFIPQDTLYQLLLDMFLKH